MFLTLRSTATRDFRPINWTSSFAGHAFVLLLVPLASKKIVTFSYVSSMLSCFDGKKAFVYDMSDEILNNGNKCFKYLFFTRYQFQTVLQKNVFIFSATTAPE